MFILYVWPAEKMHDLNPNVVQFNFAPVSSRDELVFGSQRPGFLQGAVNEQAGAVEDSLVTEWCQSMREKVCGLSMHSMLPPAWRNRCPSAFLPCDLQALNMFHPAGYHSYR